MKCVEDMKTVKNIQCIGIVITLMFSFYSLADSVASYRNGTDIEKEAAAPPIPKVMNEDIKQKRAYPMQPPLIPHKIEAYQVDLMANKCLSCHSRKRTQDSQAPMISVTHFMDREGNFLAEVSPRRYFCNQCHVPQRNTEPVVKSDFVDIDTLLSADQ